MDKHKILIVEDESIVALNLQQRLTRLGYNVVGRAASGADAIRKAVDMQPDLVLMDIHIEGPMDGIDTAEKLLKEHRIRVVYLTAYSEESTLERARQTLPYGYLIKPFTERELHSTLQMSLERRADDLKLYESEQRTRLALESAAMGSWEFSPLSAEFRAFGLASTLLGDGDESFPIPLDSLLSNVHADDREMVATAILQSASTNNLCSTEFRRVRPTEAERWIRIDARSFVTAADAEPRLIGVVQDVTRRHAIEARLREAATVFDQSSEGFFVLDGKRRLVSANSALDSMTGCGSFAFVGNELPFLTLQGLAKGEHTKLWSTVENDGFWQGELRIVRPNGDVFPARLSLRRVDTGPRDDTQIVGILSDFTELRSTQEKLRRLAHFDSLTELPNRLLLLDRMAQASSRAGRNGSRLALLFLDLDHFKRINDTHGHSTGDLVLREAATRMQGCIRHGDTVARLGGDEFVVLLENIVSSGPVVSVAEKLREALGQPIRAGGQLFHIGASIGIAMYPDDGVDAEQLLQCADTAMYEAKTSGRNRYAFYNSDMAIKVARYLARDLRLRSALKQGELCLHYQPQVDSSTGSCQAVEALIRWKHPELGLLGAAEVIPAAEESGLIVDIGRWALREACAQAKLWQGMGCPPFRIAVNVSAKHVSCGTLYADIENTLNETRLDPSLLEIEITESAIQTESVAVTTLSRIRTLGVSVAIDDFGTGYSCLSSLKHLPLDRIKIDSSFVRDLPKDPDSAALTETIIGIANRLKLHVTAEGVETPLHKEFLSSHGCHELQGWLFSPAVAAADIPAFLSNCRASAVQTPPAHIL